MDWGSANPVAFLNHWATQITRHDARGLTDCRGDPHVYLVKKVFELRGIKKPGSYAWPFWDAGPDQCI